MSSTVSVVRKEARRSRAGCLRRPPPRVRRRSPWRPRGPRQRRAPAPVPRRWSNRSGRGPEPPHVPVPAHLCGRLARPARSSGRPRAWAVSCSWSSTAATAAGHGSRSVERDPQRRCAALRLHIAESELACRARRNGEGASPRATSNNAARAVQLTRRFGAPLRRKARADNLPGRNVREGPGRKPRRDRHPRDAHARGARGRHRGRLLRA